MVTTRTTIVYTVDELSLGRNSTYQGLFYRIIKKAEIQNKPNFHSLRHTFATRALEMGIPAKTVSEILGHSNISITKDLYSHVSIDLKKDSINQLADLFII